MGLKLIANDAEDLQVVSSAMQDAILRIGDIRYDVPARSLSLRATRFRHESDRAERVECGMRIDGVLAVRSQGIDRARPDAFGVLLGLQFEADDAPAGSLRLTLAGGGEIEVDVEGLDLLLSDVGEGRKTRAKPDHGA